MIIINIIVLLLGFFMTYISLPYFLSMLKIGNCLESNYLNQKIPISVGTIFAIIQTFICTTLSFFFLIIQPLIFLYCILTLIISLVSLLDDLVGEKNTKGLKGHIHALFNGRLTTGGLKAIVGFMAAILISIKLYQDLNSFIANILLIALLSNTINLFDLRPGRGLKVFILLSTIMILTAFIRNMDFIMFSAIGIVLAYLPNDIREFSMMGDIGSNFLGITLGFYSAISQHYPIKVALVILLILLHLIGEFYSFTKIINENRLLRYFDNLGRQKRGVNSD